MRRATARPVTAGEPASVLAARQLAAEAVSAHGRRAGRRRARATFPIRPLPAPPETRSAAS